MKTNILEKLFISVLFVVSYLSTLGLVLSILSVAGKSMTLTVFFVTTVIYAVCMLFVFALAKSATARDSFVPSENAETSVSEGKEEERLAS